MTKTTEAIADNQLRRFDVSMEGALLDDFDNIIERKGYRTRSEAISDLVRSALPEESLTDETADAEDNDKPWPQNNHCRSIIGRF